MILEYWTPMMVSLIIYAALLAIVSLWVFFLLMYSTLREGAIGLDFCFLLEVISKGLIMGILVRFSGNFYCFYALKVLVVLVLSLGKNVSIRDVKSTWSIFTSSR